MNLRLVFSQACVQLLDLDQKKLDTEKPLKLHFFLIRLNFKILRLLPNCAFDDSKCKLRYCDDFSVLEKAILMKKNPEYDDT